METIKLLGAIFFLLGWTFTIYFGCKYGDGDNIIGMLLSALVTIIGTLIILW